MYMYVVDGEAGLVAVYSYYFLSFLLSKLVVDIIII